MPAVLALALCSSFVIFLLHKEHRSSQGVTRALWIPTIWMIYIASKPLGVWFKITSASPESGSPMDRAFLTILMIVALWMLFRKKMDWSSIIRDNKWLILLIVFMFISIVWSEIPLVSFKRWIRELLAILMGLIVLSEPSPRLAIESIMKRTIFILIPFSLLLIKYFPFYGVEYGRWSGALMWIGVTQQKNELGRLCMISIFFLIWSYVRRRQQKATPLWKYEVHSEFLLLVMTAMLMMGPHKSIFYSATSLFALIAGLSTFLTMGFLKKRGIYLPPKVTEVTILVLLIIGIAALFTGGSNISFVASSAGRNTTFTGRTEVWAALLPIVWKRPILGGGFGSFWTPATRDYFRISGGHSGYLDTLLGLGFVGVFLTTMFLLSSARKAQRLITIDFDWAVLCICYIIMAVIHNITESSIDSLAVHLTAVILFISISLTKFTANENRLEEY